MWSSSGGLRRDCSFPDGPYICAETGIYIEPLDFITVLLLTSHDILQHISYCHRVDSLPQHTVKNMVNKYNLAQGGSDIPSSGATTVSIVSTDGQRNSARVTSGWHTVRAGPHRASIFRQDTPDITVVKLETSEGPYSVSLRSGGTDVLDFTVQANTEKRFQVE